MRRQSISASPPSALQRFLRGRAAPVLLACACSLIGAPVHSAVTLPNTPLQAGTAVPPNIMFILDDSGSMEWDFMPGAFDSGGVPGVSPDNIKLTTYTRNTLYYNPATTYLSWRDADGSFVTAPTQPYAYSSNVYIGGSTTNLRNSTRQFHVPKVGATNMASTYSYYRYRLRTDGTAERCEYYDPPGWQGLGWYCGSIASFTWTAADGTVINRTIAQEWQNFANWYSFHRTRSKVAKAGASYAFAGLGNNVRVGFETIWHLYNGSRDGMDIPVNRNNGLFEDVAGAPNRSDWYEELFDAQAVNGTPLRPALDEAGEYFEDDDDDGPWGPEDPDEQITCRQNFSILTTDGYWNTGSTSVGNSDNANGPVHTNPSGATLQYTPAAPWMDGWSNTLADVAMHYWKNDLRSDMANNVPTNSADPAFWQHMVTFGISIGLQGTLDPDAGFPASWPNPMDNEDNERIDDLWHAAVNGHGEFVAATNPDEFAEGLKDALSAIIERVGSSSNVSVNGTKVGSDTQVFQGSFVSGTWTGELNAFPVDASGVGTTPDWSASGLIPAHGARDIFTHDSTESPGSDGSTFTWAGITAAQKTALGSAAVLDYVRGDASNEERNAGTFRDRNTTVLGDIDHSSPVYVDTNPDGDPSTDDGTKTVYVGSNDGMLHAFDATTGVELFAYVPKGIDFTKLRTLSDPDYAHHYFVDGEIAVSTREQTKSVLYPAGRNILVGLLGRGGKSVYALDVSDPATFGTGNVLWEFSDPDLGNALGEPIITRLNNGKTGVIFGNGYNSATGRSVLFVLDIETGAVIKKFDTGTGDTGPNDNGMATPRGWDANRSGTFDFVYAGDLLGNVWKFDLDDANSGNWAIAAGGSPLFVATDAGGVRQPITGGMAIGLHPITFQRWIFFGTGRYLTTGDPSDRSVQGWYGLLDDGTNVPFARGALVERDITLTTTADGRPVRAFEVATTGDMDGMKGWVVNLETPTNPDEGGERIVTRNTFSGSVLLASSIIPSSDACATGGRGYLNFIDPFTGAALSTPFFDSDGDGVADDVIGPDGTPIGSVDMGVGMPTMPSVIQNGPGGEVLVLLGGSEGEIASPPGILAGAWGRISWREILRD